MNGVKKGLCPACKQWVPLTKGGRLVAHHPNGAKCRGVKPTSLRVNVKEVRFSVRKTP